MGVSLCDSCLSYLCDGTGEDQPYFGPQAIGNSFQDEFVCLYGSIHTNSPELKKKYIKIIIKITLETASIYGKNNLVTMSKYLLNPCQRPSLKAKNTYRQEKSWTNKKGLEVKLVRRCFFTNTIPDFISWFHHDKNIFLKSFKLIFNS